jgi:hypothetical protein
MDPICPICRESKEPGWMCEKHPGKPWGHEGCEAAGTPCVCNPEQEIEAQWDELEPAPPPAKPD